jgi:hypothetical protein
VCVCVCVCVRERECVSVCVCVYFDDCFGEECDNEGVYAKVGVCVFCVCVCVYLYSTSFITPRNLTLHYSHIRTHTYIHTHTRKHTAPTQICKPLVPFFVEQGGNATCFAYGQTGSGLCVCVCVCVYVSECMYVHVCMCECMHS